MTREEAVKKTKLKRDAPSRICRKITGVLYAAPARSNLRSAIGTNDIKADSRVQSLIYPGIGFCITR
jgi:hypothetical protein